MNSPVSEAENPETVPIVDFVNSIKRHSGSFDVTKTIVAEKKLLDSMDMPTFKFKYEIGGTKFYLEKDGGLTLYEEPLIGEATLSYTGSGDVYEVFHSDDKLGKIVWYGNNDVIKDTK